MSIIKNKNGFTLLEVLISVVIMSFVSIGLITMQSSFGKNIVSRKMSTALTDVANNQIQRLRLGLTIQPETKYNVAPSSNSTEGQMTIYSYSIPNTWTPPTSNNCSDISIVSTDGKVYSGSTLLSGSYLTNVLKKSKTVTIQTTICNFN
jgi:prepilin-type N-terminal cleavage/methylation domain-containing protein